MAALLMPKLGLTMTEGTLTEWHVAPGDSFSAGDLLFTVETEKVANDVDAVSDGTLDAILVPVGETVPVGAAIAETSGTEAASPTLPIAASQHDFRSGEDQPVPRILATPLARRIARIEGLDLARVQGTGPKGRIKAADVRDRASNGPIEAGARKASGSAPDMERMATARRVVASKRDVPHFYLSHDAEVSALMALRADLNADGRPDRVSVTHMLIRALGLALSVMPGSNRIWHDDKILSFEAADVGMVVETPGGLRVPAILDAGGKSLDEIAATANQLARRAREGGLAAAELAEGAISISNVGMFGVSSLTPVINPPNAMMLGVGADRRLFRPDEAGKPALRHELTLTLACDHRVIDGADAARFLSKVVAFLETPLRLLRPRCPNA